MRAVSRAAETAAPSPNNSLEVRANHGALTGPNPVDRGKLGSRYHLLVDGRGIRLAVGLSAANTHDSALLKPMVDAVSSGRGAGPADLVSALARLYADKGSDHLAAGGHCAAGASARGSSAAGSV